MRAPAALLMLFALVVLAVPARAQDKVLPEDQKQAIHDHLQRLHEAYGAKDLDAVMGLIAGYVEAEARDYQQRYPDRPGADQAIRDAYLAFHEDIFRHEQYRLLDFQEAYWNYSVLPDGSVEVQSSVPIIATESMTFTDADETPVTVNLRIGHFVLVPDEGRWRIVKMDLF